MNDPAVMPWTTTRPALQVDAVLCISLENRSDRRALLLREFAKSDLAVEFVIVTRDPEDPQRGCFTSHQHCARIVLERGYRNALVLEDDATLDAYAPRTISRINRFIETRDPELLHLGVILGKMWLTWTPGIARCRAAGAHAYIISRAACEKLLGMAYAGAGIDTVFRRAFRQYCVFPMICHQQPEKIASSDIDVARKRYEQVQSWDENRRKQYVQIAANVLKTALRRDL